MRLKLSVLLLMTVAAFASSSRAQEQPAVAVPVPEGVLETEVGASQGPQRTGDPYEAYAEGVFDQALQGFVDDQVERPDDQDVLFNIASSHYQMKNYEEAEKSFARIAMSGETALRGQAFYNLGNCAYRQGKLQEAVELYKAALEVDPEDQDAKFNLEFVRDEIRRRHEEAQKRQQDQQQQDQEQQQNQEEQQQDQNQQQQDGQQQAQDSDQDGLPDDLERTAQNPTDPRDADSDDDGLLDGQEDRNANGSVDPGETDPNDPDSDDDGATDGEEAAQEQQGQQQPEPQPAQAEEEVPQNLTPEEAERYLQALQERRPDQRRPQQRGQRRRPAKDW